MTKEDILGNEWIQLFQHVEHLVNLVHFLNQTSCLEGDVAEFGTFWGGSAMVLTAFSDKPVHVYDSFEGLPEPGPEDGRAYEVGALKQSSAQHVYENFRVNDLKQPIIHVGRFENLLPTDIPAKLSFVHYDGDLFAGAKRILEFCYRNMVPGAVMVLHDYASQLFPGVKTAADMFFANRKEQVQLLYAKGHQLEQAYFVKL